MSKVKEKPGAVIISNNAYSLNAIGAVRSLGIKGVKVTWITPKGSKWFYSKYCQPIICPDFRQDEKRFIEFLVKLGKKRSEKDVLIPTSDHSLISISKNKILLSEYFRPMVCDWATTEKFINKSKIYRIAESIGIPIPLTFYPENEDEAEKISYEVTYPCLLKPALSHMFAPKFKRKLFKVSTPSELIKTYRWLVSNGHKMIIQEDISGEDENLVTLNTVFNERSEPLVIFMHRRLMQNPPGYGVVSLGESVWEPRIIHPCIKLLKTINFQGIAHVEFKRDPRTGVFKFLEVNGRSYLSISLPTASGVNLMHIAYRNAIGEKIAPLSSYSCTYKCGVKWVDIPSYIESMIKLRRIKNIPLRKWIKPLLGGKVTLGAFSRDDPKPFVMELNFLFTNLKVIIRTIGDHLVYKGEL